MENLEKFMSIKQHDGVHGCITASKMSYDERFIVSSGKDGLVFCHVLDKFMIQQESKVKPLEGVEGVDYMPEEQVK